MPTSIRDARQLPGDRLWIERAYDEYLVDLAADQTGVFPSLAVTGEGVRELLQRWFRDDRLVPFVILRDLDPAGFAVVQRTSPPGAAAAFGLSEYFVRERDRRRGIGRNAAVLLFDRFAGEWTVSEEARHHGAISFWRKVISGYTRGRFQERVGGGQVHHTFSSAGTVAPGSARA